ncbi:MAG: MATE family efflux transporter [Bacillota bacterium]|nr:MATE family efflux transporter [Bacillota bacterium]
MKNIPILGALRSTVPKELRSSHPPNSKTIYKGCLGLAVPSTAEALFQSLIACVDTIMVGALGAAAISAVGLGSQVKFLLMAVIYALNYAIVAIIARRKGEGNSASLHRCFSYSLILAFGLSSLMSVLGYFFVEDILTLLGASSDYIKEAALFVRWLLIGNILSALSMAINSTLRGVGNARASLISNSAANILNVVMNYCLISGNLGFPALGVKGAAIATVLGNLLSLFISFYYVIGKKQEVSLWRIPRLSLDLKDLRGFWLVGSGALVEQIFTRIGYLTYAAIVTRLGTTAFAAHSIALNLVDVTFMLGSGIAGASSVMVGQNLGAGNKEAAVMSSHACQRLALGASLFIAVPFLILPEEIIRIFTSDTGVIQAGAAVMPILALCSLFQPQMLVLSGSLRGAGDAVFVAFTTLLGLTLIRPALAWLCCYPLSLGLVGAWLGMISDHILRTVLNTRRCQGIKWLNIRI